MKRSWSYCVECKTQVHASLIAWNLDDDGDGEELGADVN